MNKIFILICMIVTFTGFLMAQTEPLTITFFPTDIFVNVLNTSSFDPVNPYHQPILSRMRITNNTQQPMEFRLNLIIRWNNVTELANVILPTINPIQPGQTWELTNRDFISQHASIYFDAPEGDISLQNVIDQSPILREALESGIFPDGTINFTASVVPSPKKARSNTAVFNIRIKNIRSIFLTYPGAPFGQNPPIVNLRPISFLWSTTETGNNNFRLLIKEFTPSIPPTPTNVETLGRTVYNNVVTNNVFNEFLPYQENHYYAWQVRTYLWNEQNFGNPEPSIQNAVVSPWFVFQYSATVQNTDTTSQEITSILNMLNIPEILSLLNQGYIPTGIIILEGQVYTGQQAVDLIYSLIGKTLQVEIKDQ